MSKKATGRQATGGKVTGRQATGGKVTDRQTTGGVLTLVATPIGNLGDISERAVKVLTSVPVIGCEDTRRTGRLLEHLRVDRTDGVPRLLVVNETTETAAVSEVLKLLNAGADVALVSDAGTPGVADPGTTLVAAAAAAGYRVTIVPGPSAPLAALAISGVAVLPHVMEGWLPRTGAARRERIAAIAAEHRTVVLLESPQRIAATLDDLATAAASSDLAASTSAGADRICVVVRELTKLYEQVVRSTLGEIVATTTTLATTAATTTTALTPKGEFVVVLGPLRFVAPTDEQIDADLRIALGQGTTRRTAVERVAEQLGVPRNRVYNIALMNVAHNYPTEPHR